MRTRQATSNNFRKQLEAKESGLTDGTSPGGQRQQSSLQADEDPKEIEEDLQELQTNVRSINQKLDSLPVNYVHKE